MGAIQEVEVVNIGAETRVGAVRVGAEVRVDEVRDGKSGAKAVAGVGVGAAVRNSSISTPSAAIRVSTKSFNAV